MLKWTLALMFACTLSIGLTGCGQPDPEPSPPTQPEPGSPPPPEEAPEPGS